ncbi:extracellular solute-binding protein [Treponema sp.]
MKRVFLAGIAMLCLISAQIFAGGQGQAAPKSETSAAKTELKLWDQYYRGVENDVMEQIVEGFSKANPDLRINRSTKTLDDLKLVLKMSVESGDGPDLMQLNQGEADMGAFVKAGLVEDLSKTAQAKKWESAFSAANLKMMGYKGSYYGVAATAEVVGFYYNKDLFSKLNLSIPTSFAELESLLAKIKAAGYVPINFGNLDAWPGIHVWSALQHVFTTRPELDAMMSGKPGKHWAVDANLRASQKLQEWVSKGYFTAKYAGIGYDDSVNEFMRGDSALMLTGNWLQGEFSQNAPFATGFFIFPAESPKLLKAIGGPAIPFVVSAKSSKKDAAVRFLDYMASPEAARLWAKNDMLPAYPVKPTDYMDADPLFLDILRAYDQVIKSGAMGYYIDWITPTFYDTSSASIQRLMAGELNPAAFVQALQTDYETHYQK